MKEEIVKALIEWVNAYRFALRTWVLDVEASGVLVGMINIWAPGQTILKQIKFYKRELFEHEAIVIGFSIEGKYITHLPVLREVFENENATAHLFAELILNYCELLETYSYEQQ